MEFTFVTTARVILHLTGAAPRIAAPDGRKSPIARLPGAQDAASRSGFFARSTLAPDIRAAVEGTTATNQHPASTTVMAATLSSARSPYPRANSAPTSANRRLPPKPGTVLSPASTLPLIARPGTDWKATVAGEKEEGDPDRYPVVRGQPTASDHWHRGLPPHEEPRSLDALQVPSITSREHSHASGRLEGTARRRTKRPPRRGQIREAAWPNPSGPRAIFCAPRLVMLAMQRCPRTTDRGSRTGSQGA